MLSSFELSLKDNSVIADTSMKNLGDLPSNRIDTDERLSSRSLRDNTKLGMVAIHTSVDELNEDNTRRSGIHDLKSVASNIEHRNLEDVNYWRHRAGWYDDDGEHNMDDIYSVRDDYVEEVENNGSMNNFFEGDITADIIGVTVVFICLVLLVIVVRTIRRKSRESGGEKHRGSSSRSRSTSRRSSSGKSVSSDKRSRSRARSVGREGRSRSKSRGLERERSSRSKSKSRGKRETANNDYSLMEDGDSAKKSSRTRSKSRSSSRRKAEVLV